MNEVKPFASLSSGLLARKGQAKPAMRPQGFGSFGTPTTGGTGAIEDLGWNDMGHDRPHHALALTPMGNDAEDAPRDAEIVALHADYAPQADAEAEAPVVLQQREEIERSFGPDEEGQGFDELSPDGLHDILLKKTPRSEPVEALPLSPPSESQPRMVEPSLRAAPGTKARAAFTLRLDQDRHLKLRLAAAVSHRSAQALVVEALDTFLAANPAFRELGR